MNNYDVIIIGAGAAGLMAAKILSENNMNVCVLEARNRIGGRVHTIDDAGFSKPIEAGAEFIHGNLPLTVSLLKEAGIEYYKVDGEWWQIKNGKLQERDDFIEHADLLIKKLKKLENDISIAEFLKENFPGEKYHGMQKNLQQYIEGYDAGDIQNTSALAFKEDWENEEDAQYRIKGGYGALLDNIKNSCLQKACNIYLSHIVKQIRWSQQLIEIITNENKFFTSNKVIITVPVSLLAHTSFASISFNPALPHITNAARQIGYGGVIKIILEFTHSFWDSKIEGKAKDFFFIFSSASSIGV